MSMPVLAQCLQLCGGFREIARQNRHFGFGHQPGHLRVFVFVGKPFDPCPVAGLVTHGMRRARRQQNRRRRVIAGGVSFFCGFQRFGVTPFVESKQGFAQRTIRALPPPPFAPLPERFGQCQHLEYQPDKQVGHKEAREQQERQTLERHLYAVGPLRRRHDELCVTPVVTEQHGQPDGHGEKRDESDQNAHRPALRVASAAPRPLPGGRACRPVSRCPVSPAALRLVAPSGSGVKRPCSQSVRNARP